MDDKKEINKEIFMDGRTRLIVDAINEVADCLGNSNINPLSISLICLDLGISNDQKGKLYVEFNQILQKYDSDDLKFSLFRDAVHKVVPDSVSYADGVIVGIIKAFARNLISELKPYADFLEFSLKLDDD